jgi:hypothetical protein
VCDCNSWVVCDRKKTIFCVSLQTQMIILWLQKKAWTSVWLQLFCACDCNQKLFVVATSLSLCGKSYLVIWLFMIISLSSVWLQTADSFCDCKLFLCVSLQTVLVILWLQKNLEPVCDCNYFACVIATRSYLWLHHDWVCVVKATWLFGYLWLQAWVVCDCKQQVRSW